MSLLVNWLESMHVDARITDACSRKRHTRSTCSVCADSCPMEAIHITSESIKMDLQHCNSCGDCLIACPLSAIQGILESREFDKDSLVYNDSYTPLIKELLIYKKRGVTTVRSESTLDNQKWIKVINNANDILVKLDENTIKLNENREEKELTRRAFFSSLRKEGYQLAKNMTPATWKMEAKKWNITRYFPDYQFFQVRLEQEKCTFCQMCFSFCSQKVFILHEGFLQVENEKCVNCYDCRDICPENALKIELKINKKYIAQHPFHTKNCQTCGKMFSTFDPNIQKCPICHDRDPEWLSPYQ